MEPDRWREVERLYHAALERDPEVRAAFLAAASGGDEELLDEVQSLLEQHTGDSRLDRAVWEPKGESTDTAVWEPKGESADTRFAAGTQLGQYRIEAALGAIRRAGTDLEALAAAFYAPESAFHKAER